MGKGETPTMSYKKWFVRIPEILQEEIDAFHNAGLNFCLDDQKLQQDQIVTFTGTVAIENKNVQLELVYPDEFPHFPIVVFADEVSLQRHQNPFAKNLCVIPHNQDGWEPWMTGAFMVKQAIQLLQDSKIGPEAVASNEVPAPEPWSNYVQYKSPTPIFISKQIPFSCPASGRFTIRTRRRRNSSRKAGATSIVDDVWILNSLSGPDWTYDFPRLPKFEDHVGPILQGDWFRLDSAPDFNLYDPTALLEGLLRSCSTSIRTITQLQAQVQAFERMPNKRKQKAGRPRLAIIFPEETHEPGKYRMTFLLGMYFYQTNEFAWSQPQFLSVDDHFYRIPDYLPLHYESILVVGIGSLGSAVALELGKCGIGIIELVDFERLDAGNLVRHTGTIEHVGLAKTDIVAEQIRSHFPWCQVTTTQALLGQVDSLTKRDGSFESLYHLMNGFSLVIDTTADGRITSVLNRIAVELGIPVIHSWVSNGAWGGRVIRYVPGKSGCFQCFDSSSPGEMSSAPISEIYPGGCGFPTFAGTSFDIYEIATHTVRMACSTLLGKQQGIDHVLIQHYPEPIVKTFTVEQNPACAICGTDQ